MYLCCKSNLNVTIYFNSILEITDRILLNVPSPCSKIISVLYSWSSWTFQTFKFIGFDFTAPFNIGPLNDEKSKDNITEISIWELFHIPEPTKVSPYWGELHGGIVSGKHDSITPLLSKIPIWSPLSKNSIESLIIINEKSPVGLKSTLKLISKFSF